MTRPRLSLSLLFTLAFVLALAAASDDAARGNQRAASNLANGACSRACPCPSRASSARRAATADVRHANPTAVPHAFAY